MKHRLTFFKATLFLGALFSFSSCGKSRQITADGGAAAITDAENLADDLSAPTQLWHQTDECIFILFGYGYNDSDFVANMTRTLFHLMTADGFFRSFSRTTSSAAQKHTSRT